MLTINETKATLLVVFSVFRGAQCGSAGCLAVKADEFVVDGGVFTLEQGGLLEEDLAEDGEEFGRGRGGVGVDGAGADAVCLVVVDTGAEVEIGGLEGGPPALPCGSIGQGGDAVGGAGGHVELVSELVDDDIDAIVGDGVAALDLLP